MEKLFNIKKNLLTGIVLLLPLIAVLFIINLLLSMIGAPASEYIFFFFKDHVRQSPGINILLNFVSFIVVILSITLFGWISNYFLGKYFMRLTEKIIHKIPFIGAVYSTVKQVLDIFKNGQSNAFQKTVLVEFPSKGCYSLGFLTGITNGEVQEKTPASLVNVFVPTTPNPTNGFLILLPKEEVMELNMSVSDAIKMIVSGGTLTPPYPKKVDSIENNKSLSKASIS